MPNTFTVRHAEKKKDVEGRHGPMQVIAMNLQTPAMDEAVWVEWFTQASTPLPADGSTLEGALTRDQYGWKFKKAAQSNSGGGQRGSFKEDPAKTVRILRQHSQHMSLKAVELAIGLGIQAKPESFEDFLRLVRRTADFMDRDVEQAVADKPLDDAAARSQGNW